MIKVFFNDWINLLLLLVQNHNRKVSLKIVDIHTIKKCKCVQTRNLITVAISRKKIELPVAYISQ